VLALRVLIVEDSEPDTLLVCRELARGNYEVTHRRVDTPAAMTEALRSGEWDLVISDFSLPGLTAMDALSALAASLHDIPCIVVSGTTEEEAAVDALRSGARDFIVKDRLARLLPSVARELREAAERRQKRAAEAALAEATSQMRFALEAAGVGTWQSDFVTGRTIWSEVLERLHGKAPGTFGRTFAAFMDAIDPDDRQRMSEVITLATRDHAEARLEYRVTWPDGSIHWIAGVGQTFYDETGRPLRAAGIGMDITRQKQLEEQFRQAQRMESIGNLAGGIAHDFNNLLTAILGYSNVLLEDAASAGCSDQMKADLQGIRAAGERAATLTNQLLAFSRRQIIQPRVLSVNAIVKDLQPMLRRLIREDIALTTRLSPELCLVSMDIGQLEQVIVNLAVNARDAISNAGTIAIETARVDLDETDATVHLELPPGPYVRLAMSDTGVGMPPEIIARIFEPFFTTKPQGVGTGLGLATIYGIVKQNHGDVSVSSEPGKGSTFTIHVPRVDAPIDTEKEAVQAAARSGVETILLVEDDVQVRALAKTVLVRKGYVVIEAANAEEALRLVTHRRTGDIDLLLTDVVMPGMSGRQLVERVSEQYRGLKVLYMSGYTDDAIVHYGVLHSSVAFLRKPFTPATLANAVRAVLDQPTPG